mmetsp:Transcript_33799/g.33300  ORF Transcript_33799/g.33300 Transcript_33799/m.33300 type:complete len:251 (-) Transcript_33799:3592-4344(-)
MFLFFFSFESLEDKFLSHSCELSLLFFSKGNFKSANLIFMSLQEHILLVFSKIFSIFEPFHVFRLEIFKHLLFLLLKIDLFLPLSLSKIFFKPLLHLSQILLVLSNKLEFDLLNIIFFILSDLEQPFIKFFPTSSHQEFEDVLISEVFRKFLEDFFLLLIKIFLKSSLLIIVLFLKLFSKGHFFLHLLPDQVLFLLLALPVEFLLEPVDLLLELLTRCVSGIKLFYLIVHVLFKVLPSQSFIKSNIGVKI